jgi:hypothetical protein
VAAIVLVTFGACGDDDDAGDNTDSPTEGEPAAVATASVTTVDFAFEDLPELDAGVTELTIDNQGGTVPHEFAILQYDGSIDDFTAEMPAVLQGGPFPEGVGTGIGSPEVPAGESATFQFTLPEAGSYVAFCVLTGDPELAEDEEGAPHIARGMVAEVTVGDGDGDAAITGTDGTITAVDYDFEADVEAGASNLTFTNDGPDEYHFAGLSVYPEGTTADEAVAAFNELLSLPEDQPPPEGTIFPEDVASSGVAGPGTSSTFEVPGGLESGRTYVVVCFISDKDGGPPHAIGEGMVSAFTVE